MFCAPGAVRSQSCSQGFIADINCGIKSSVWGTLISAGAAVLFTSAKIKHTKLQVLLDMQQETQPANTWKKNYIVWIQHVFCTRNMGTRSASRKVHYFLQLFGLELKFRVGSRTGRGCLQNCFLQYWVYCPSALLIPGTLKEAMGPLTQQQHVGQVSRSPIWHRDGQEREYQSVLCQLLWHPFVSLN